MIDKHIDEALNNPRGSGRTTRMLLSVMEYLLKNQDKVAIILCHDSNACGTMENSVRNLMSRQLAERVKYHYMTESSTYNGVLDAQNVFKDHHCYYVLIEKELAKLNKLMELYKQYD